MSRLSMRKVRNMTKVTQSIRSKPGGVQFPSPCSCVHHTMFEGSKKGGRGTSPVKNGPLLQEKHVHQGE